MIDTEIVIVGAGAAGLSAAATLRGAGRSVVVLEAGAAIGGRARTVSPGALRGASVDEGATWLHLVASNPLAARAWAAGEALHPAHQGGRRLSIDARPATAADAEAYEAADAGWRSMAEAMSAEPDQPLSAAGDRWGRDDPWLANLEHMEGAIIAAADADALSLHDWHANQIDGSDLRPAQGVGALLARHYGPPAGPVRCAVAVRSIDWTDPRRILIETDRGTIATGGCIVTVSTGVLRAGGIRFAPALPDAHLSALDGLPMGLLSKLAIRVDESVRFGIADGTLIESRLPARGAPGMLLCLRPDASPLLTGFLGGRHAWSFAGREQEALAEARDRLRETLGADATRGLAGNGFVSRWGSDPLFLGSYAYARPGHAGARAALGVPFGDGRLVLAGEACRTDGMAGTVGGAILDGERAANALL